jgi:hypothetical protein
MALVMMGANADDQRLRQLLAAQIIGRSIGDFGNAMQGMRQQKALGELLAGQSGPGLDNLTQQHAPGLNPALAGPALALRENAMAKPGMVHTGGNITPEMARTFVGQGGDPSALASLMPKPLDAYQQASLGMQQRELAAKAPTTRDILEGGERVFQQFDPATGQWSEVGRGQAFAPATQITLPGEQNAKLSDLAAFRGQYQGESKNFTTVRDAYGKLRSALQSPSPAGDLSVVYAYNQMLDPTSVVRESDFAAAAQAGSFGEKIKSAVEQITSGQLLTDAQRADFAQQAHGLFQSQLQGQQGREADYQRIAGATVQNVAPDVMVPDVVGQSGNWQAVVPPPAPPSPTLTEQAGGLIQQLGGALQREYQALTGGGQVQLPKPLEQMTPMDADSFVGGLSDEQLRTLPPATLEVLERLMAGGR